MQILLVKLSSLGDVVHCLPVVQDLLTLHPGAQIDWVVEEGFADICRMHPGVRSVIPVALRRWRRRPDLAQMRAFMQALQSQAYDLVLDLQGLTKSALIARLARLGPNGRRVGMANATEGSSFEAAARWLMQQSLRMPTRIHALDRSRLLAARAVLGEQAQVRTPLAFGLQTPKDCKLPLSWQQQGFVVCVHAASSPLKAWPQAHWGKLFAWLGQQGLLVVLPVASAAEQQQAEALRALSPGNVHVLPKMPLTQLAAVLRQARLVVGLDSGVSHLAAALLTPTLVLYCRAHVWPSWRTGPFWQRNLRSLESTLCEQQAVPPSAEKVVALAAELLAFSRDTGRPA